MKKGRDWPLYIKAVVDKHVQKLCSALFHYNAINLHCQIEMSHWSSSTTLVWEFIVRRAEKGHGKIELPSDFISRAHLILPFLLIENVTLRVDRQGIPMVPKSGQNVIIIVEIFHLKTFYHFCLRNCSSVLNFSLSRFSFGSFWHTGKIRLR